MADEEIIMKLYVNLECERCNKKIRRVLEKMKADKKMGITATSFSETTKIMKIHGRLDVEKVKRKLRCEADGIFRFIEAKERRKVEREPADAVDDSYLRPLLEKMLERPKAGTQPGHPCTCKCGCSCGKQTTRPLAQCVPVAASSVWPAPASSVSGHDCDYEAPSTYYGVPVYSIQGLY